MKTIRSLEGELTIDHRNSPGVPEEVLKQAGLPTSIGRGFQEMATYTCGHCQYVVVMNPQRTRDRHYCRRCEHVICDACAVQMAKTLQCRPFAQVIDEALTAAAAAHSKEF